MAAHSNVLAWRIPGTGGPGRLPSMGPYRVGHDWSDLAAGGAAWGSRGKNTAVVCHSLLQWTMFGQNGPPWPIRLGRPHMAWLIASLSHAGLWSMWLFWLVSCDCGFHFGGCGIAVLASSIYPLMDEDKRLVHTSDGRDRLWGKLGLALVGRPHSGRGHAASLPLLPLALPRVPLSLSLFSFSYKTTGPVG